MDFEDEFLKGTGRAKALAQHMVQSFALGEVSPEEAHRIGRELCDKFLKGNYQYVIATHVDRDHIHNHIIFNNVTDKEDKKPTVNTYENIRKKYNVTISDNELNELTAKLLDEYFQSVSR